MPDIHLHFHIGESFDHDGIVSLVRDISGGTPVRDVEDGPGDEDAARIADVLARFQQYDPHSRAPELVELARELGFEVHPPRPRGGAERSNATYLRFRVVGDVRTAIVYLNTVALFSAAQDQREFASRMPGADVRTNEVYFGHTAGTSQAALRAFRIWADDPDA